MATPDNGEHLRAQNSPSIIVDPKDSRFLFLADRWDSPGFNCALLVSGDAGQRWVPLKPVPQLPAGADACYAPEISFDKAGTLHYLFVGLAGPGHTPMGVFMTSTPDRGRTFTVPRQLLGPTKFQVRMQIDRSLGPIGRMHLVWVDTRGELSLGGFPPVPNPIMASYSDDGGANFSEPQQVSDLTRERVVSPAIAVGANHALHVLYYDLQDDVRDYRGLEGSRWDGYWSLVTSTSRDGGETFAPGVVVDAEIVPAERVMLIFTMPPAAFAADRKGRVYVAWADARHGDADILLRRSVDHGASWQSPRRLNDDLSESGAPQYLPAIAVSPSGRLDAIFYDRRLDSDHVQHNVFFTFSYDLGRTFAPNVRITSEASDSRIGQRYRRPWVDDEAELGSRIGLVAGNRQTLLAWTDSRNAPVPPYQDVFVGMVDLKPRSSSMHPAIIGGAFTLVVAMMLFAARRHRTLSSGQGTVLVPDRHGNHREC